MTGELLDEPEMQPVGDPKPNGAAEIEAAQIGAALRDLIWRVEHVRLLLQQPAASTTAEELAAILDTADARRALRLADAQLAGDDRAATEGMRRIG